MEKEIIESFAPFGEYQTYYRIANPHGKKTPLLILHGGPGSTSNSYQLLDHFAFEDDRPIVIYDQIGCGKSSIPDDRPELYNKDTWAKEVDNLREYLHLDSVHLMGHSWGGMLSIIYLCDHRPSGVKSVTLSSTLSSASLWKLETHRIIKERMGAGVLSKVLSYEESGDFENQEFKDITDAYMKLTVSNFDKNDPSVPLCLREPKRTGKVAYKTGWGDSEFTPTGNLHDYDYTEKLSIITIPSLLISGSEDESTPLQNQTMLEHLGSKEKEWHRLEARHMTYYEQHDQYVSLLKAFLNKND